MTLRYLLVGGVLTLGAAMTTIMVDMKPARREMIEGPEAFARFRDAVKNVLTAPMSAVPNPFGKRKPQRRSPLKLEACLVWSDSFQRANGVPNHF
jgi:hypothetical protein